jgi:signal transduction histidine kinase
MPLIEHQGITKETTMGERTAEAKPELDLTSYVDLLGHDVLNSNQAVLSYLELMISSPSIDPRTKKYAQRAASHIRACAVLIDNVKRMTAAKRGELATGGCIDLVKALRVAADKVVQIFPDRKVEFRFHPGPDETIVLGGALVPDMLLNLLINVIQLDQADQVVLKVEVAPVRDHGTAFWRLAISDENTPLPQALAEGLEGDGWVHDRSRMVKMTGLVFAKLMAEAIGGTVTVEGCTGAKGPAGSAYVMMLKGGESR